MADLWSPGRYTAFKDERAQPFYDLLALVEPRPGLRILDLGCGTGELTLHAHRRLQASETLGIDSSPAMLARAPEPKPAGFRLTCCAIEQFQAEPGSFDLLLSNAALHWVGDHEGLLARLTGLLSPSGQLAVQVPANEIHPSNRLANRTATEQPFTHEMQGYQRRTPILDPDGYRRLLDRLGFARARSHYRTYHHELASTEAVVEWVRSTLLTDFERRLSPESFARFLARYRENLLAELGDVRPYRFSYRRLFVWGSRDDGNSPMR